MTPFELAARGFELNFSCRQHSNVKCCDLVLYQVHSVFSVNVFPLSTRSLLLTTRVGGHKGGAGVAGKGLRKRGESRAFYLQHYLQRGRESGPQLSVYRIGERESPQSSVTCNRGKGPTLGYQRVLGWALCVL